VIIIQLKTCELHSVFHAERGEGHDGMSDVVRVIDRHVVRPHSGMSVLESMPGSGNASCGRLRMRVAMATSVEDDAGDRGSDVNEEAVRHSSGLQTGLVPSSHCDVIARAVLQVHCGKCPAGVEAYVKCFMVVRS